MIFPFFSLQNYVRYRLLHKNNFSCGKIKKENNLLADGVGIILSVNNVFDIFPLSLSDAENVLY